jgi:hypothetical protein
MNTITKVGLMSDYRLNELIFLNELETQLGENWTLKKTKKEHCNVDFVVRRNNKVIGYMELKCRAKLDHHPSLMIGYTKLQKIQRLYKQSIIVWFCVDTQTIWSCKYDEDLLNSETDWFYGSKVYLIDKSKCGRGMEALLHLCLVKRW